MTRLTRQLHVKCDYQIVLNVCLSEADLIFVAEDIVVSVQQSRSPTIVLSFVLAKLAPMKTIGLVSFAANASALHS